MKRTKRILLALVGIQASVALASTAYTAEASPEKTIETLHETLLVVMKEAETLGYEGRYDRLAPAISAAFDLDFMGSKAVGRHWRELDEDGQKRWLTAFQRFTIANYAGRFDGYSGQSFEILGDEPASHETILVRAKVVNPDDEDVQLNYRLRQTDDGWRVIDVYLNGSVSELALRRAEYSSAFDRNGLDEVLSSIESRIAGLAASAGN
jgi:phospholipid transport system substrate-binding protein